MTTRSDEITFTLDVKRLAIIGGLSLAAGLGINQILKKSSPVNSDKPTEPTVPQPVIEKEKQEEPKKQEDDADLLSFDIPLVRKNTMDLDREARNYREQLEASLADRNALLDELKFLEGPTSDIQRIPHLSTILGSTDFPKIVSPLLGDSKYRSVFGGEGFMPEESFVSQNSYVLSNAVFGPKNPISSVKKYLKAGPRTHLFFEPGEVKACIVTCGGLCPGLNVVIREIYNCLYYNYKVKSVYGIKFGYKGFYKYDWIELTNKTVKNIHNYGGTILGSSRGGFDLNKIMDKLVENGINQIYCVGGDGTHRGIYELYKEIALRKLKISVIGIPKTIDNDINVIDTSFGFETAVEEATKAIASAYVEATSAENGIGLVKLMGREAGFIAMYASLSSRDVDVCLVPEFNFELNGPDGLLRFVQRKIAEKGHCVIVVAEGAGSAIQDAELKSIGTDASGNPKLPDVGVFLKDKLNDFFKQENIDLTLKYIDPTYMIRTVPANSFDKQVCSTLAQNAVSGAMSGWTGFTIGTVNERTCYIPLSEIITGKRRIQVNDRTWQRLLATTGQASFLNDEEHMTDKMIPHKKASWPGCDLSQAPEN